MDGEEVKRVPRGGEVDGDVGWLRLTNDLSERSHADRVLAETVHDRASCSRGA